VRRVFRYDRVDIPPEERLGVCSFFCKVCDAEWELDYGQGHQLQSVVTRSADEDDPHGESVIVYAPAADRYWKVVCPACNADDIQITEVNPT
jgi:hypothetical protein